MNMSYLLGTIFIIKMDFLDLLEKWINIFYRVVLILIFVAVLGWLLFSLMHLRRKRILFRAWINRYDEKDEDLGKSIGDLLLFDLQTIKIIHDKSTKVLSLWNPYQDLPSFKQGLEQEVQLIASVELGDYGKIISSIASFALKAAPLIIKPAILSGSINKYGDKKTLLMITLANYHMKKNLFQQKKSQKNTLVWKIERENLKKEEIPELLEEMAYRIYIDLTGNDLFKSWECFRYYTIGMQKYINYTELQRESDYNKAIKSYNEALQLEPNNPVVCYNKGVIKYNKYDEHENKEAIELFKKALNSSDMQLQVRARTGLTNGLVMQYHRFNKKEIALIEEGVSHGEEALRLNSKLDSVHKCLGFAYHQLSEELSKTNGWNAQIIVDIREKAINHYKKAFNYNKQHYIAHNNLGNLYLE